MSKPVTENAFVTAWPGSGLPNADPVAERPGREDQRARRRATTPISRTLGRRPRRRCRPGDDDPDDARARRPRCGSARPGRAGRRGRSGAGRSARRSRGSRRDPRHEQARAEREDRERHRRVGQRRVEEERQVDGGGQAGAERRACGPGPVGRPRSCGDVGREPPGEDRARARRRARSSTCAAAKVGPRSAIGIAARNVGSGSQTSNAGRGKTSGGVCIAPQRVATRGRGPRARLRATPT